MTTPFGGIRAEEYGDLQRLVDQLFPRPDSPAVTKIDVLMQADVLDLCRDLREVVETLPSGTYSRPRLCDQVNSIVVGHGWGFQYGTVE